MMIVARSGLATTLFGVALGLAGCEKTDLGDPCGTPATLLDAPVVEGETPIDEVVRVQRDGACESFKCLTHAGLAPYCTDTCTYDDGSSNRACVAHSDCPEAESCVDGKCKDDSCPKGFYCRQVQAVGPLAAERYCVRREGCERNFDCEDLGELECKKLGCFDACLLGATSCDTHFLTCQPTESLPCRCPGAAIAGEGSCGDAELTCQPEGSPQPWPTSAVNQRAVCVGKKQAATAPVGNAP